ncbi:hypothetical protein ES703_65771 [subsurface metagenome]
MEKLSTYKIEINSFQAGALLSILWGEEDRTKRAMMSLIHQLITIQEIIKEKAGVTTEKLPNGTIKMTSEDGVVIVRAPHEWET